ncbi:MAG: hypothetical protein LBI31_04000, partial [Zoogloeaceae bacterium]|nr:hypothetical protein [Zoogloeaceae bacterium]
MDTLRVNVVEVVGNICFYSILAYLWVETGNFFAAIILAAIFGIPISMAIAAIAGCIYIVIEGVRTFRDILP